MKRLAIMTTAVLVLALGAFMTYAATQDAQGTEGVSGSYNTPTPPNAINAEGGNVTEVNVSSAMGTTKWQGYWGNISASLILGDGANTFYDWSGISVVAVYASPGSDITFGGLSATDTTVEKEAADTLWSFLSAEVDSINQTMTGNTCAAGTEIAAAAGVTPEGTGAWATCIAEDGGALIDDYVFGTNVASGVAYNGDTVDYQLMVPVLAAGDLYYFYLEI